jgi:hypothetical protein
MEKKGFWTKYGLNRQIKNSNKLQINQLLFLFVRMKGLEPIRLSTPAPKTGAYTNSATSACIPFAPFKGLGDLGCKDRVLFVQLPVFNKPCHILVSSRKNSVNIFAICKSHEIHSSILKYNSNPVITDSNSVSRFEPF